MRSTIPLVLALALATFAPPAAADGLGHGGPGARGSISRGLTGHQRATHQAAAMREFTARRSFAAGVRLRELSRDARRRSEEARLRRTGSLQQVRAYRQRLRLQEDLDDLRIRSEASRIDPSWFVQLGPVTRRVLAESGIPLHRFERRQQLRRRIDGLERDVESRVPAPALPDFGSPRP